jgi:oligopeptide/dipeptide ABC transporter ATP-binding protein
MAVAEELRPGARTELARRALGSPISRLAGRRLLAAIPVLWGVTFLTYGLSYLFIAHDLALVKQVSDRVAVMYLGKLCEVGPGEAVYRQPLHPYTRALLDWVPGAAPAQAAGPGRGTIRGEPPSPVHPPSGCRFRTRCPRAAQRCADEEPHLRELATGHSVACHFPLVATARTTARSEEKTGEGVPR